MSTVLDELGKKIAERWMTLLVLPGLLYVATLTAAVVLGQRLWYGTEQLVGRMEGLAGQLDGRPAALALLLLGIVLAAAAAGLLAQGLAGLTERIWTVSWSRGPARLLGDKLVERRARKWDAAHKRFLQAEPAEAHALAEVRNRIGLERPVLPARIGDRLRATQNRVWQHYGLDLATAWPRLWLVVDDATRQTVAAARRGFDTATTLAAWGALYAALAVVWWPGGVIGAVVIVTGARRGLRAAAQLADLVEAVVDLRHRDLARALGLLDEDAPYSTVVGRRITEQLRKGT
ncbi:hypothetical protein ACIBEJ_50735 [Nonomuraea sp. NPDC050790]|uniref:hypothetical protein n=1 Tax=Nonomuraea sp. NPDC050790 TaxID=3364371 RepID=UPI0037B097BC